MEFSRMDFSIEFLLLNFSDGIFPDEILLDEIYLMK